MPGVKKFLPITRAAEKNALFGADVHDFGADVHDPRVLEKLCTKKFALILVPKPRNPPKITILAVNSDHGLSFAGEQTRTMV